MTIDDVRRALREHHAGVTPDAGFADRVAARLTVEPVELLGRVALRLLPAALALVVALGWLALKTPAVVGPDEVAATSTVEAADDDLLGWVLDDGDAS